MSLITNHTMKGDMSMQKLPRMFFVKCTRVVFVFFIMLMLGSQASPVHARPITEIVVFGDSLSDTGNVFAYLISEDPLSFPPGFPPSPLYDNGRFSNGPVWVETLADGLGLTALTSSLLGGTNYAWGGAETGYGLSFLGTPNIGEQIDAFFMGDNAPSDKHLYVIWAGSNDFNNADIPPEPADLVQNMVQNISGHITAIANAALFGTELKFLVANLPPLGQTARAQWLGQYDPSIPVALDLLSWQFNAALSVELDGLETNPGIKIFRLDIFSLTQQILTCPYVFGFTNVTDTARIPFISPGPPPNVTSPGTDVVGNPDEYFFFDDIHPTRVWHTIVGNLALSVVSELIPEPIAIDIKPQSDPNSINPRSKGKIPVAILSTMDFSAPDEVDIDSLMFGASGGEESLSFCNRSPEDVNGDGYDDLVCHFYTQMTGFGCEDREGIVRGLTIDGIPIEGRDFVKIVPCNK